MSDSLWPRRWQHTRLPCPSPTPGAYSNSCPSHQWCHSTISSSVIPFSFCLQSFPASGSFPVSQLFASGGQSNWSFSFSISSSNEYSGLISFRTDWFDLLAVQGTPKSLLQYPVQKHQFLDTQLTLWSNSHIHTWLLEKPSFVGKVMSLLFNMLSRLVIAFLLRSKSLIILWLQSPSAVILEPPPP